ncbi:hypothetical protein RhiJN_00514 [Ceratobasidium sp. AG-Ba]|nr:hypothetical protein RhiJN_00514 [Ceratobasidium sp. AG-Ba]QRW01545.1 hypothetical protein RhiLY_00542 [Ceratobasidium sp. AG-Ba]
MGRGLTIFARFHPHSHHPLSKSSGMPPKPKPAVTARQAQSKSKPTSKRSYVPPELAGSSTRKTWVPASRHKIAEAKFHSKGKSAGHSSDKNESGHEDDGNEIAGEDEKGNNGDESDMDGGRDNSEIADESGPQYYDRDGNPVPIEEIAAVLQRPRDPTSGKSPGANLPRFGKPGRLHHVTARAV